MSRIDRDDIWDFWLGNLNLAYCLCCQASMMDRHDSKTWVRGHLIPHRDYGYDIYENIAPICIDCNTNDKPYPSNFHYRVYLKLMTLQKAREEVAKLEAIFITCKADPSFSKCVAEGCSHRRKSRLLTCGVHAGNKSHERYYLRDMMLRLRQSSLEHLKHIQSVQDCYDPLELQEVASTLTEGVRCGSSKQSVI